MRRPATRLIFTVALLSVSLLAIWQVGRGGLSRFLASYGATVDSLPPVVRAVELSPTDPEAHYLLAALLSEQGTLPEAITEYERAVALRPDDYVFRLQLAEARDNAGDSAGALMASKQAVRLAPFYAQPRWQLGNLLLRAKQTEAAFAELRSAARSDPARLPILIEMAWQVYKGDVKAIEGALEPRAPEERLALARFFIKQGNAAAAVAQFRATGDLSSQERRAWLTELLAAKRFPEAYELWLSERGANAAVTAPGVPRISNGGFEDEIKTEGAEFGWRLIDDRQAVSFALDTNEPREGTASLRLEFRGSADPASTLIAQLVPVEPNARYRLRFAARAKELKTGGLPLLVVSDASSQDGRELGQSALLPQDAERWREYALDFATGAQTGAVLVKLRRQGCSSSPCPIFGFVWLDGFSLEKL